MMKTICKLQWRNFGMHLMGNNQQPFLELFEKEFHELTILGNNFRIRHHETTKTDIQDKRHYEYFYKRCLSLISTAIQYLDGRNL